MGLDMYIYMDDNTIAYWRKANQIHGWFVRRFPGFDNCSEVTITKEDMLSLLNDLMSCVNEIVCIGYADEVCKARLPTMNGCFFGELDYGDWYADYLFDSLQKVLHCIYMMSKHPNAEFIYTADW